MNLPASWRALGLPRPGRRSLAAIGLLAAALGGLGWVAWRTFVDPWPARATFDDPQAWLLGFSADGRDFLSSDWLLDPGATIMPREVSSGRARPPWADLLAGFPKVWAFSPDGRSFAIASSEDVRDSAKITLVEMAGGRQRWSVVVGHSDVYDIGWTADGKAAWACLGDSSSVHELATWDPATGEKLSSRAISAPGMGNFAAVSRDGRVLAYYSYARWRSGVTLWDLEEDRSLGRLENPSTTATVAEQRTNFTDDGRTLAISQGDGSVAIWDVPSRTLLRSIPVHSQGGWSDRMFSVNALAVAPDGRTFASVAAEPPDESLFSRIWGRFTGGGWRADSELIVVDIATGRHLARARTGSPPVYSPDGRTIATRDEAGIRIRDVPASPRRPGGAP